MSAADSRHGPSARRRCTVGAGLAVVLASWIAYYPVLDNFFLEFDDPTFLALLKSGSLQLPLFRPLQVGWMQVLWAWFGADPFPFYLAGLLLHALNGVLVVALARRMGGRLLPATVAGLAFAVLYAPHEAILWISAVNTLLVVTFLLLCCWAFLAHVQTGRWAPYAGSLLCMGGAMASKETSVTLALLLPALHIGVQGWHRFFSWRTLGRYVPFAVLGLLYVGQAYRPEVWTGVPEVGRYTLGADAGAKLARSMAWLFWPRPVLARAAPPAWTLPAGIASLVFFVACAVRLRNQRRLVAFGLLAAIVGFAPLLPGPYDLIGKRYAYPSAVGAALLMGGIFTALWSWHWALSGSPARQRSWRIALAVSFAAWMAVQVLALRSVEQWRFERSADRVRNLMQTTRTEVLEPLQSAAGDLDSSAEAFLISPVIWREREYAFGLTVFAGLPRDSFAMEDVAWTSRFGDRLAAGGDLDPVTHRVYTTRDDGTVVRISSAAEAPFDGWAKRADKRATMGLGHTIALFHFVPGPDEAEAR